MSSYGALDNCPLIAARKPDPGFMSWDMGSRAILLARSAPRCGVASVNSRLMRSALLGPSGGSSPPKVDGICGDAAAARAQVEKFAHDVLSNPVIEDFRVEIA